MVNAHRLLALFVALVFFGPVSRVQADESHLRALEAKAVCVALADYQTKSPKADLRHFQIVVEKDGPNFDIIFLPDPGPGEKDLVGGSTKYGAEVHYIISPRTYKIVKIHFAR